MKLKIEGMHCKSCRMLIEDVLGDEGIIPLHFEMNTNTQEGILDLNTEKSEDEIKKLIEDEGDYKVKLL